MQLNGGRKMWAKLSPEEERERGRRHGGSIKMRPLAAVLPLDVPLQVNTGLVASKLTTRGVGLRAWV